MEIRRFGIGHRRPDGPPGSRGVRGQIIHSDARGVVSELAFGRRAAIELHTNPNTTWFIVIEGGGFVRVGAETSRVASGEAVLWPAGEPHAAWTDVSEMRAIVAEFADADDAAVRGIVEGRRRALPDGTREGRADRAEGKLAPRPPDPATHDPSHGEPF